MPRVPPVTTAVFPSRKSLLIDQSYVALPPQLRAVRCCTLGLDSAHIPWFTHAGLRSPMQDLKPSRTAQRVALRRAAHQLLDSPPVFHDPLAVAIAGPGNTYEPQSSFSRGLRAFIAARSRYAEDHLTSAVERGVRQYVVLGAG